MSIFDQAYIFIRKSDKTISIFDLDGSVIYSNIDSNLNSLYSKDIITGDLSFADTWFDIDTSDNIYGIINNKKGKLINVNIRNNDIDKNTFLKYDYERFFIKFPLIKNIFGETHLIYYLIDKNKFNSAKLFHIYKHDGVYKKNIVDCINYNILTNFVITWDSNIPTIFYFKIVNGCEEIFTSSFDLTNLKWSTPIKITNSRKPKIYLSIIKSNNNKYHIAYSEDNNKRYYCKYLTLSIENNEFKTYNYARISDNIMCLFPSLIECSSTLYIQWVEYYNLYTCKSNDGGNTWTTPHISKYSSYSPVLIYEFKSNFSDDCIYNVSSLFTFKNCFDIDKILPKY
ncbi:MAG: hypothetical protein ACRC3Y_13690 [Romboutsia sp.]|uniref:hypothetical protein n=1 Tax=Romboutsia sp. TaxID=1965302 RepID=UPI003F406731